MNSHFLAAMCSITIALVAAPPVAYAQQKTVKACQEEWRANKEANKKDGITEKDYVAKCRAAGTTPTPAPTPAAAPPPTPAPSPAPTPAAARKTVPKTAPTPSATAEGQFATEALAKAHCPADTVVWVNLTSKVYHFSTSKSYGKTKRGTYMCEKETASAGFRAAKNEKHP
jgi:outer membrane biosynthesis protein TonB